MRNHVIPNQSEAVATEHNAFNFHELMRSYRPCESWLVNLILVALFLVTELWILSKDINAFFISSWSQQALWSETKLLFIYKRNSCELIHVAKWLVERFRLSLTNLRYHSHIKKFRFRFLFEWNIYIYSHFVNSKINSWFLSIEGIFSFIFMRARAAVELLLSKVYLSSTIHNTNCCAEWISQLVTENGSKT